LKIIIMNFAMKTSGPLLPVSFPSPLLASLMAVAVLPLSEILAEVEGPVITTETKKGDDGGDVLYMYLDSVKVHEADTTKQPLPPVVKPGEPAGSCAPPSDAVVLFDGSEKALTTNWTNTKGEPSAWKVVEGALESATGSGYIQTRQGFGSCQLHIEWATPAMPVGDGQNRGNSGVFLMNTYEVQVLDSFENITYADGQASALYGRSKPLVNACRKPGEWQSYDIVFHRPLFDQAGKVTRKATFTVLHNGVLTQDHVTLSGGTGWMGAHAASEYQAHPDKLPIAMQDHGSPVRYRNVWVRELKD
jgi:Domain of Unknown Function (DUF1080)